MIKRQHNRSRVQRRCSELVFCALAALLFDSSIAQTPAAGNPLPPGHPPGAPAKTTPAAPAEGVDINSASVAELKTLPGIGEAEAKKIIAGRPYLTKVDLVTKNVLPEGVYVALRDRIIAKQAGAPASKK